MAKQKIIFYTIQFKSMKLRILILFLMCITSISTFAQFRSGVKGGANLSSINFNMRGVDWDIYEPRMGINAGLLAEYMFNRSIGVQSELNYYYSGANINSARYTQGLDIPEGLQQEGYLDMHTFQLPVYLKTIFPISTNLKIYIMGGGFASFSPSAYQHIKQSFEGQSMKYKWSLFDNKIIVLDLEEDNVYMQQRWNVGLAAEAGVELNERVTIGLGFRRILNNMAAFGYLLGGSTIQPTIKMWNASISAGYFF